MTIRFFLLFCSIGAACEIATTTTPLCGALFPHFQVYFSGNQIFQGNTVAMGVGEIASLSLLTRTNNSFFRSFTIRATNSLLQLLEPSVPEDAVSCSNPAGMQNTNDNPRTLVVMRFVAVDEGLAVIELFAGNATIAVSDTTCFRGHIQLRIVRPTTRPPTVLPSTSIPTLDPSVGSTTSIPTVVSTDGLSMAPSSPKNAASASRKQYGTMLLAAFVLLLYTA